MTAHTDDFTQQSDSGLEINSTHHNPAFRVEIQTDPISQLRLFAAINIFIDWLLERERERQISPTSEQGGEERGA